MEFPKREGDVETMAETMIAGLTAHIDDFPAPPVPPLELTPALNGLKNARNALAEAESAYEAAMNVKLGALQLLVEAMKKDIRYAENITDYDNEKLVLIGWGGKKPPAPVSPPGSPRDLVVDHQGEGVVELSWRKPEQRSGGALRAYLVLRRELNGGELTAWTEIATPMETEAYLENQPKGIKMEYRIVAVNAAGSSMPSNTVAVVL